MDLFSGNAEQSKDRFKGTTRAVASVGTLAGVLNASTLIIALPTMRVKPSTTLIGVTGVLIVELSFTIIY